MELSIEDEPRASATRFAQWRACKARELLHRALRFGGQGVERRDRMAEVYKRRLSASSTKRPSHRTAGRLVALGLGRGP
jgi:hypothetical protein